MTAGGCIIACLDVIQLTHAAVAMVIPVFYDFLPYIFPIFVNLDSGIMDFLCISDVGWQS